MKTEMLETNDRYANEQLSWLDFNARVLHESTRKEINPILERINFLCIADSNLDEFIRTKFKNNSGLKKRVLNQCHAIECSYKDIVAELRDRYGITITTLDELKDNQDAINSALKIFEEELYPLIQPMILKDNLPIPDMQDNGYFAVSKIDSDDESKEFSGIIKLPETRLVKLKGLGQVFVRTDDIIHFFISKFYQNKTILWTKFFRVFRKVDSLFVDDNENYLKTIKNELESRKKAEPIMVDISDNIDGLESILEGVKKRKRDHPSGLGFMKCVKDVIKYDDDMVYRKAKPRVSLAMASTSIFDAISQGNILVHFPYESFNYTTLRFLDEAANDPNVKVIKQTLYRVSQDSPIIKSLITAAKAGKQVVVLLEVKAKFDEEHNLKLIDILQKAGCNIIFGPIQLKTHAKVTLVIREEDGSLEKYCNISTGNFNDQTAKVYEDLSFFCKEKSKYKVGTDLLDLFNALGGCSKMGDSNVLAISPVGFRKKMMEEIDASIASKQEHPDDEVTIRMKCNSFTDTVMADKLYEASVAGVKVKLIVRGMCIVKAKVPGLSDNIEIKSVIGRYLEHSRIYEFIYRDNEVKKNPILESGLNPKIYIGSGDMMPRNLDYRVEVVASIRNRSTISELHNILDDYEKDQLGSYVMDETGMYQHPSDDPNLFSVQNSYIDKFKAIEKNLLK